MLIFRTHTQEVVTGERLQNALDAVALREVENAYAVRGEDQYADHVTESEKNDILEKRLAYAEKIRAGTAKITFTLWQQINTELTGKCVSFLPQQKEG